MLLSIFLAIVICGALVFASFLFAPLTLSLSGSFKESARHFTSYVSWFHPAVFRCDVNGRKRSFSIIVFGRFKLFSSENDETPGPVPGTRLRPEKHEKVEKPSIPSRQQKPFEHVLKDPGPHAAECAEDTRTEGPSGKKNTMTPQKVLQKKRRTYLDSCIRFRLNGRGSFSAPLHGAVKYSIGS
jgi:hypothetical protein